jgi:hypothetical protein
MWELLAAVILIVATPLALVMADFGGMSGILIRNATFPRLRHKERDLSRPPARGNV